MVAAWAIAKAVWSFLAGGAWKWALPLAALLAVGAWGGWQYVQRLEAENALEAEKVGRITDANDTWEELDRKRQAFEADVRQGFEELSRKVADLQTANTEFQARVKANANSNRPLDPVERDALRMLGNLHPDQAGGRAVQPAAQSSPVRGR